MMNEKDSRPPPGLQHVTSRDRDGTGSGNSDSSIDEKGGSSILEKHHGGMDSVDVQEISHDIQALTFDIEEAIEHARTLRDDEVLDTIHYIVETHSKDPNFPPHVIQAADRYLNDPTLKEDAYLYAKTWEELKIEAAMVRINSPYPEVRAIVDNHDDPTLPVSTFRAWSIGLVYVAAGAFINQFFSIRQPGVTLYANVAQLLAFPAGKILERILPTRQFSIPIPFSRHADGQPRYFTWSLNPGRFNMKEHMLITIMANVGFNTPYTDYIIWVQYIPRFFNQPWARDFGYQILISLSTNFIGYGLAGITRRFLVYPEQCIWPTNLATIALNKAFHSERNEVANGWRISRMKYFLICFVGMFVYFWFPNYIIQAMSYFNWIVWIKPEHVMLAAVTGGVTGLGLNPLPTFDWNQWTVNIDPLINPFFSSVNFFIGALITFPIIMALWVNNVWYTGHLPINSNGVFDNTGHRYNVSLAVNDEALFDVESFRNYSPAYLAAGNILLYGVFFAVYSATVSHAILYHRHEILNGFRNLIKRRSIVDSHRDVHSQLMRAYKEVPEWWYFLVLCVAVMLGAVGIGKWPTHTTPAVVLYGIFLAIIFCVPIGIIKSITNIDITLNVLAEFIGGSWFPGNASAMNFFKSYGYVTTAQTLRFAQDLKLAHYVHIPQRITFVSQMVATLVSTFVCIGILNFQMTSIEDVCSPTQANRFTCPGQNTFFTASVLWGTLGPTRMFGKGAIYSGLVYCFLIGFFAPFIFYFLGKRYAIFKSVHLPVIFAGGLIWAPYNLMNIWPAIPVAWLFNFYIKKRYLAWWSKYNYITTSAFAVGIALSGIITFFALQYEDINISWSGNNLPYDNCDGNACVLLPLAAGERFGPVVGQFS